MDDNPLTIGRGSRVRRWRNALLVILAVPLLAGGAWWTTQEPRDNRAWIPEMKAMPAAHIDGNRLHISNVRNFRYQPDGTPIPGYYNRTYALDDVRTVWFVVSPFTGKPKGLAHSFVTFGFADSSYLAISVEARREVGERYDALAGLLRHYELIYVIGDERDVIGKRALLSEDPLYLYPIKAPHEKIRAMLVSMVSRANGLRARPEFYNTLTNNCTSTIVDHVNQVSPKRVPAGLKTMLPGYADEVAMRIGLIDAKTDIEKMRPLFRINDIARAAYGDTAFSLKIRESLGEP